MRRLVFVATGPFFIIVALLPLQHNFVVSAVSVGERLAMYSKPSVVRHVHGAFGSFFFQPEENAFPYWLVGIVLVVLFFIVVIIGVGVTVLLIARRRSKAKRASAIGSPGPAGGALASAREESPAPAYSPSPNVGYSPLPSASQPPSPGPSPQFGSGADQGMTVDLSRTIAIIHDAPTAPMSCGSMKFISGALAGQQFEIKPEGEFMGRDASLSEIVIADPRISKRHLWIGMKDGRVVIADQGSRNGTFINDPRSQRVTEAPLNPGDTVILGESDVARFEYQTQ